MSLMEIFLIGIGLSMDAFAAVSYTHLDVYKRQFLHIPTMDMLRTDCSC